MQSPFSISLILVLLIPAVLTTPKSPIPKTPFELASAPPTWLDLQFSPLKPLAIRVSIHTENALEYVPPSLWPINTQQNIELGPLSLQIRMRTVDSLEASPISGVAVSTSFFTTFHPLSITIHISFELKRTRISIYYPRKQEGPPKESLQICLLIVEQLLVDDFDAHRPRRTLDALDCGLN